MFKKILLPVVIASALSLNLTGCSTGVVTDAVPDMSQEALRAEAMRLTEKGDFALARDYLEALDSRYPFGELTDQVQLDLIYAYYKSHKSEQATAAIERFLRLNPNSMYTDYALYMKGLNELQKHGTIIQDYLGSSIEIPSILKWKGHEDESETGAGQLRELQEKASSDPMLETVSLTCFHHTQWLAWRTLPLCLAVN